MAENGQDSLIVFIHGDVAKYRPPQSEELRRRQTTVDEPAYSLVASRGPANFSGGWLSRPEIGRLCGVRVAFGTSQDLPLSD
jgi:hypothetical protein